MNEVDAKSLLKSATKLSTGALIGSGSTPLDAHSDSNTKDTIRGFINADSGPPTGGPPMGGPPLGGPPPMGGYSYTQHTQHQHQQLHAHSHVHASQPAALAPQFKVFNPAEAIAKEKAATSAEHPTATNEPVHTDDTQQHQQQQPQQQQQQQPLTSAFAPQSQSRGNPLASSGAPDNVARQRARTNSRQQLQQQQHQRGQSEYSFNAGDSLHDDDMSRQASAGPSSGQHHPQSPTLHYNAIYDDKDHGDEDSGHPVADTLAAAPKRRDSRSRASGNQQLLAQAQQLQQQQQSQLPPLDTVNSLQQQQQQQLQQQQQSGRKQSPPVQPLDLAGVGSGSNNKTQGVNPLLAAGGGGRPLSASSNLMEPPAVGGKATSASDSAATASTTSSTNSTAAALAVVPPSRAPSASSAASAGAAKAAGPTTSPAKRPKGGPQRTVHPHNKNRLASVRDPRIQQHLDFYAHERSSSAFERYLLCLNLLLTIGIVVTAIALGVCILVVEYDFPLVAIVEDAQMQVQQQCSLVQGTIQTHAPWLITGFYATKAAVGNYYARGVHIIRTNPVLQRLLKQGAIYWRQVMAWVARYVKLGLTQGNAVVAQGYTAFSKVFAQVSQELMSRLQH